MRAVLVLLALSGCTSKAAPLETCTQAVCPLGGHTYEFCSTQGTSCRYVGSDNRVFACSSCASCNTAIDQVGSWCSAGITNNGTTTSGTTTSGTTTSGNTTSGTTTSGTTTSGAPLTGCNGLVACYDGCGDQTCYNDCDASATQDALDLVNTLLDCIDTNCYQAINADGGMPYCSSTTLSEPACSDCYSRIYAPAGACKSAQTACLANKP